MERDLATGALATVEPTRVVIVMLGEHDAYSARELAEALTQAREAGKPTVVDMTETSFADSAVLHTLRDAHERGLRAGLPVVLQVAPPTPLARLFQTTRFLELLPNAESREDAIQLIRARPNRH